MILVPAFSDRDLVLMSQALQLAEQGIYSTKPNPRVGCVIADTTGAVLGSGWHRQAGEAHAEINALQAVSDDRLKGSTAYVTLEPCSHHGKTGPCADALIAAGVGRVVIAMTDPNPMVAGRGIAKLESAGIHVDVGLLETQAHALNQGFIGRMLGKRPFMTIKLAMSLDGRTAMSSGESKWITGAAARCDVQRLRARSSAVVTGVETVLHDDPSMRVRYDELGFAADVLRELTSPECIQPVRVILDSRGRLTGNEAIFGGPGQVLHVSVKGAKLQNSLLNTLEQTGARSVQLGADPHGHVALNELVALFNAEQYNEVLIEAGSTLSGAFIREGLCDELRVYLASKLMGSSARPLVDLPFEKMSQAIDFDLKDVRMLGSDIRLCYGPVFH